MAKKTRQVVGVGLDLKHYEQAEKAAKRIHPALSVTAWARGVLIEALTQQEQDSSKAA